MDSYTIFISLIYYVGIASCAAQGAENGKYEYNIPLLHYIVNAFGGGFLRDVIFLKMYPWLLTPSAFPDLVFVAVIGFLYTYYFFIYKADKKQYSIAIQLITITDALGLGSFICIGMDKAFIYSNNVITIIACGYITAIGGGILASEKSLAEIFQSRETVRYHFITLLGCCYYYIFRNSFCLVYIIAIGLFIVNIDYKKLYNPFSCSLIILCFKTFLLYPVSYNKNNNFQRQRIIKLTNKLDIYTKHKKIYLVQQRIRQC